VDKRKTAKCIEMWAASPQKRSHRYKDTKPNRSGESVGLQVCCNAFAGRGVYAICASIPSSTWLTDWLSTATRLLFNMLSTLRTRHITQLHRSWTWVESLSIALSNYQHAQGHSAQRVSLGSDSIAFLYSFLSTFLFVVQYSACFWHSVWRLQI